MPHDKDWIVKTLIDHGRETLERPRQRYNFTKDKEANTLIDDIDHYPHAFVLACAMERGVKSERAWIIPYKLKVKLGDNFSIGRLSSASLEEIKRIMIGPPPLHRFPELMSNVFYSGVQRIVAEYDGDASRIWQGEPSSALVVYRFYEFKGIGPKIANMAANSLVRDFKILLEDQHFLDVSADVHVRRVFGRLGLTKTNPTTDDVIYRARAVHPNYPGLLDLPCWEIGRDWCKPKEPRCNSCYMNEKCPTSMEQWRIREIKA